MISKLRSNYRLSNILARIAFVLTFVLYSWQNSLSAVKLTIRQMSYQMSYIGFGGFSDAFVLVMALFVSASIGVGLMFLVPLITRAFLSLSRFYNVPNAEYALLAHVFTTLFFLVCGALRLINLFTPLLLVWGDILFPFVMETLCVVWFYVLTTRLYFNDVTKWVYFRNVALVYFFCTTAFGVVL